LYSIQSQFHTTKSNRLSPKTRVGFKGGKFSKYSISFVTFCWMTKTYNTAYSIF
jgi:hypothetical protein